MQEHFLFDDEDPKQRGRGCDALQAEDAHLKFHWRWPLRTSERLSSSRKIVKRIENGTHIFGRQYLQERAPCQISEAVLENGWCLETVFWHFDYEARVERYGEKVASYHIVHWRDERENPLALLTRLDAQLKAEELFEQLDRDILDQLPKWKARDAKEKK